MCRLAAARSKRSRENGAEDLTPGARRLSSSDCSRTGTGRPSISTIHPILEAVLATHTVTAMTYLVTELGKPFSVKDLGNRISDWWRQAGMPHLTSRSVRRGLATNEAAVRMLEAMFG